MRLRPFATIIAGAAALSLLAPAPGWSAERIVSLNLCTDELLLRLAPEKVASITWLSRSPSGSNVPDLAGRVPVNHGLAEQVVAADPDLVLAGTFTARIAVGMLRRTAIPVVEFSPPRSFDEVRQQIRDTAALLQAEDKGRALNRGDRPPGCGRGRQATRCAANCRGAEPERCHRRTGLACGPDHDRSRVRQYRRDASHRHLRADPA